MSIAEREVGPLKGFAINVPEWFEPSGDSFRESSRGF